MSDTYAASLAALTPDVISSMSREEAGAALDRLSDQYRGVQPTAEIMKFNPTDAVEANAKLNALKQNADWMKLYSQGHPDAVAEVKKLSELIAGGTADLALAGVVPEQHFDGGVGASLRDQIGAALDCRMNGLNASTIAEWFAQAGLEAPPEGATEMAVHEILTDKEPPRAWHESAKRIHARLMGDPRWCERLYAKDPIALTENLVLAWGVACYLGGP